VEVTASARHALSKKSAITPTTTTNESQSRVMLLAALACLAGLLKCATIEKLGLREQDLNL